MLAGSGVLGSWVLWLAASSGSNDPNKDALAPTIGSLWHVCLSPACVADGAHATLEKVKALAPPGTQICAGRCESQCGKGPIIVTAVNHNEGTTNKANQKKLIYSRMTGDALLNLLLEMNPCLLEGYELVEEANEYFLKQQDYKRAIPLYEAGIEMAVNPATELVQLDEGILGMKCDAEQNILWSSVGRQRLEWLVRAYCDCAKAHLAEAAATNKDVVVDDEDNTKRTMSIIMERARVLAKAACELSNRADMDSLDQLAQVYQASNNPVGELEALQSLLDLPEDPDPTVSNNVANRRRLLGFRRAKLERELNSSS